MRETEKDQKGPYVRANGEALRLLEKLENPLVVLEEAHISRSELWWLQVRQVRKAREQGYTWQEVGLALDLSKQAAQQRYARFLTGPVWGPQEDA